MKLQRGKLKELQQLLNGLLSGEGAGPTQSHWELPVLPPPDPDGRVSSTDLLSWWFRTPNAGRFGWDEYFGDKQQKQQSPEPAFEPATDGGFEPPEQENVNAAWESLEAMFPERAEPLDDEHAQAAIECLYEFLHAFGRRDVDAAMSLISEAYHTLEHDQEVDRLRFRQELESALDGLRDYEIDVSLAQAPEPVWHPSGVLVDTRVQIDTFRPRDGAHGCLMNRRVALIIHEGDGNWRISAFSLVD